MAHSHDGTAKSELEPGPPVARRLWADLFCTCGECTRVTLAACGCDSARAERRRIVEKVERLGLGSPDKEEALYAAVLREYVDHNGPEAEVAYVKRHAWLDPLLTLAAGLAGFVLLILAVERWRVMREAKLASRGSKQTSRRGATSHPQPGRRRRRRGKG